jgi:hypothetical protein
MQPSTNNPGEAHQNGDVEQSHFRFKQAVDQALLAWQPRLCSRAPICAFEQPGPCPGKWAEERERLSPCRPCRSTRPGLHVTVSRFSTIRVLRNTYSVPSRDWTHADCAGACRKMALSGRQSTGDFAAPAWAAPAAINYRHLIDSLLRKPGAFAQYHTDAFSLAAVSPGLRCLVRSHPQRARGTTSAFSTWRRVGVRWSGNHTGAALGGRTPS